MSRISANQEDEGKDFSLRLGLGKTMRPVLKNKINK
jgi:hypothetical protein